MWTARAVSGRVPALGLGRGEYRQVFGTWDRAHLVLIGSISAPAWRGGMKGMNGLGALGMEEVGLGTATYCFKLSSDLKTIP